MKKLIFALVILCSLSSCYPYIHGAVKANKLDRVKVLVSEGHVNDREENYHHTPLIIASYYGYTEMTQYLIQNGADPNAQGKDGSTALIYAAYYNYADIAKILLDNGAMMDLKDKKGHTALYHAKTNRSREVKKLLIESGAKNQ